MYDIAIIGCGVVGAAMAYSLAKYDVNVVILEASNDVANKQTKANSAILHAGYDPEPGSLMAKTNVEGVRLAKEICTKLDVPRLENGALVLAFSKEDLISIETLYQRGIANGVERLELLDREAVRRLEPKVHDDVVGALRAPTSAIVDPWEYTIAMAETAIRNGAELKLEYDVTAIFPLDDPGKLSGGFEIQSRTGERIFTRYIINAAGSESDRIHALIGGSNFKSLPNRGQYYLLDKSAGEICAHTLFQCPSALGKGVLISPTVHGNLIVGPNAEAVEDAADTAVTAESLAFVRRQAERSIPHLPFAENIRNFSGVRAATDRDDFVIEASPEHPSFINLAGIKSPGLSAAPAIALMGIDLLRTAGLELSKRPDWINSRKRRRFRYLQDAEKQALIAKDPRFSQVVCRCETVTEGEIVEAIHGIIPPRSVDAIKRRCNAGMGRCQGSFCGPRVHQLLAREQGVPYDSVLQNEAGSCIVSGPTKSQSVEALEGGEHS